MPFTNRIQLVHPHLGRPPLLLLRPEPQPAGAGAAGAGAVGVESSGGGAGSHPAAPCERRDVIHALAHLRQRGERVGDASLAPPSL